jgi:hypothetical protein
LSASADDGVRVMTWNLYQGTNFRELIAATLKDFPAALTTTRQIFWPPSPPSAQLPWRERLRKIAPML